MDKYQRPITRRARSKMYLTVRRNDIRIATEPSFQRMIAAIEKSPAERTDRDIDTLVQSIGKWPSIIKSIKSMELIRVLCLSMVLEKFPEDTILFKQNDSPNGWFIIVSGEVAVLEYCDDDCEMNDLPPKMVKILKKDVLGGKYFRQVAVYGPKTELGSESLVKNQLRRYTAYTKQPTLLIRIEYQIYRDNVTFIERTHLEKRVKFLMGVKEFDVIVKSCGQDETINDIFQHLAESIKEIKLPSGLVFDKNSAECIDQLIDIYNPEIDPEDIGQNFYIIHDGQICCYRNVDFSDYNPVIPKNQPSILNVNLPHGIHSVKFKTLESARCFADPRLKDGWACDDTKYVVRQPTSVYVINIKDFTASISLDKLSIFKKDFCNSLSDTQIIENWIRIRQERQWSTYKRNCVKEARYAGKVKKLVSTGKYGLRLPKPPKSIKDRKNANYTPLRRPKTALV